VLAERKLDNAACHKSAEAAPSAAEPAWVDLDAKKTEVEAPAKVFRGNEGKRITIVKIKGQADAFLIAFENVRGPWNHRVVLHREVAAGSGHDDVTPFSGQLYHTVTARKNYGSEYDYEVNPAGDRDSFHAAYSEEDSKAASAQAVLEQWRRQ
jgi:hypothetical protein